MRSLLSAGFLVVIVWASACAGGGDDDTTPDGGAADAARADAARDAQPDGSPSLVDAGSACPRVLAAAERARKVLVSHPYGSGTTQASRYELFSLSQAGTLASTGTHFDIGRAGSGEIVFTPDGNVALTVHDDGSLGAVRFDAAGVPTVVHTSFRGTFYASRVVMSPQGNRAYVLDSEWRDTGGGIYAVGIDCDGRLTDLGLLTESKLPYGMALLEGGRAVLAAADVLTSVAGADLHWLDLGTETVLPTLLGGNDAFGDDLAMVSAVVVTRNGRHVLTADNSEFSGLPNRIAVAELLPTSLSPVQVLSGVNDPVALVPSPFDDTVLVVSGYDNAFIVLDYSPGAPQPLAVRGPVTYMGAVPQLPGTAVMVRRGSLDGRVLVAENLGIRQLQFSSGGRVVDLGRTAAGAGSIAIVGAIGIEP